MKNEDTGSDAKSPVQCQNYLKKEKARIKKSLCTWYWYDHRHKTGNHTGVFAAHLWPKLSWRGMPGARYDEYNLSIKYEK